MDPATTITAAKMEDWIGDRIAVYCDIPRDTIDALRPLADLGFTSVYAIALCGDIEDTFGIDIEPTAFRGQRTIRDLATVLQRSYSS